MSALQRFKQENKILNEKISKLEEENKKLQEIAKLNVRIERIRDNAFRMNGMSAFDKGNILGYQTQINSILRELGYLKD